MKINKIKWKNHIVLGNLELDLTNLATSKPFNTIVFAGENGTGKTTILKSISDFLNGGSIESIDYIDYIINGQTFQAIPPANLDHNQYGFYQIKDNVGNLVSIDTGNGNGVGKFGINPNEIRHNGCVFSKARADYKTNKITSTTTQSLDVTKYENDQLDDFTSLKQLIVDTQNQDNNTFASLAANNPKKGITWNSFYQSSKMFRFNNAFDNFFEKIKYDKVIDDNANQDKKIMFLKNLVPISIDDLSTGEKQIVFRGVYLLRNSKLTNDTAIMIDEPELSMHPKWEKKILQYYKNLFTDYTGIQKSQLFIATHSEHVLSAALADKDNDTLIITLNEHLVGTVTANKLSQNTKQVLPSITSAEINYLAFDIVSNDYHIELYGYLQVKIGDKNVRETDDFIIRHSNYNSNLYRESKHNKTTYKSLSTFIRNGIHHPARTRVFTEEQLRMSIEFLRDIV